jgi:chromodomain-helicase-DNA-binding protein 7
MCCCFLQGLGKTVQIVSMICHLHREYSRGPYLIIVPLSTLPHWKREFDGWSDLNVVIYQGSKHDRELIKRFEFYFRNTNGAVVLKDKDYKFDVLICTYESILSDINGLARIHWKLCVVDEVQIPLHTVCLLACLLIIHSYLICF